MSVNYNANIYIEENFDKEDITNEDFGSLLEEVTKEEKLEGSVVKGVITAIDNDYATIDVGSKSEGIVPLKEFSFAGQEPDIKVGDSVDVYLEHIENRSGKTVLSREKALREESWEELEKLCEGDQNVDGVIFGRVKGGFTVDLKGVVAFLPGSQVDIRPIKDISPLLNVVQPFQILKMDRKQGNIVVSRRAVLEESRVEARNELLSQITEGQQLEGVVKNITDYGAFIDLGSIDGLLHVTDISWKRISHPSEVLTLGQTINVQVIKYNEDTKRISLGMKQLESNPWDGIEQRYPIGARVKGIITNITDYGAFAELESGIEGLIHVSEVSWVKNNLHPSKLLSPGQEVEVMVLEIDPEKHRISIGIKQCEENPWALFADKYPLNSVIEGEIRNVVDFGIFVGFDTEEDKTFRGIDGLVHVSDITWDENPDQALKDFKKGDKITVKVLSLEPEKERISLGLKQLQDNPYEKSFEGIKKGSAITCSVINVKDEGIEVSISDTVRSFIKRSDLSREKIEQRADRFAVGDRVDAKVISIDKANFKVNLSIKALEVEEQKKAIAEFGSADSGASLGDILGPALSKTEKKPAEKAEESEKETKAKKATKAKKEEKAEEPKKATKAKKEEDKKDSE